MWDSRVHSRMDEVAREQILPLRDDLRVIGCYSDNEIGWWDAILFKATFEQAPTSGQRQRLIGLLRQTYRDQRSELLRDFEPAPDLRSGEELEQHGVLFLRPGGRGIQVTRRSVTILVERADWFQYDDEPTHGRFAGENVRLGLVDLCDRPYEDRLARAGHRPRWRERLCHHGTYQGPRRGLVSPPRGLYGLGGRQTALDPQYGDPFDHQAVVFEDDNGVRVFGFTRDQRECYRDTNDSMFADRLQRCREQLAKLGMDVKRELCFTGFDAYQKVMALPEVNYVLLATPPFFRPAHLRAAVEAGKHAFLEKPVAVDATGVRSVIASGAIAQRQGLTLGAGTMRRRENGSRETIRRLHEGAIGDLVACEAIWSGGELWHVERQAPWSDMEYQLRNWLYYTWLSGDFIVEQFVRNLDMINWGVGEHPVRAFGLGGRQVRTDPKFGNIFDHFGVEFQYANGVRCFALDRHTNGSDGRVEEIFLGAKGTARVGLFGGWAIQPKGGAMWRYREPNNNPYHQEHAEFIASIREGRGLNEARQVAESTLTAIMGRETAYSAKMVEWDDALNAKQDLSPAKLELGPMPVPVVPRPGTYRLS